MAVGALRGVVVVRASLAGLRAAEELRRHGCVGRRVLVRAEAPRPYARRPLSEAFLPRDAEAGDLALRRQPYDELDAELLLGVRATGLDAATRTLELDGGAQLTCDGVVLATGSAPRRLPDTPDLAGIFVLRTLED